ncbi:MAG: 2-C-methyl-D-erythritol 2,4-cyclodiphosphate synthase [Firmicutes bacterium]|nr:2-C-methyl-D-erythritol 2,4-cyclodiphosphate synthase [Bacillota bacterium]
MAETKIGLGFDAHAFASGRDLIIGGVKIPCEKGLMGHSDADVLAHSIMDAILGAMGKGDIGLHFPDSDPAYKGISSLKLLARVANLMDNEGFRIKNLDSTVILEKPKISPFYQEMKKNIAENLKIEESQINIKATTTEGMGFTGRGEGIFAQSAVLIERQ